jgi:hypothetical protein
MRTRPTDIRRRRQEQRSPGRRCMRHAGRANGFRHDDILERGLARVSFGRRASSSQVGETPDETITNTIEQREYSYKPCFRSPNDMSALDFARGSGKTALCRNAIRGMRTADMPVLCAFGATRMTAGPALPILARAIPPAIQFWQCGCRATVRQGRRRGVSAQVGDDPSTRQLIQAAPGGGARTYRLCSCPDVTYWGFGSATSFSE